MYFAWSPKHSSFLCRLSSHGASASAPSYRRKPTAAPTGFPEKKRLRRNAAAPCGIPRPRRGCGASAFKRCRGGRQEERWRGASIQEAGARHRGLANLGCFKKMLGSMITSSMLMNDRNATCHIDVNFVNDIYIFIEFYRHRFVEGNLSETRCIETCWVCLQIVCEYIFQLITSSTNSIIWRRDDFSSTCKVATLRLLDRISLTSPGS